MSRKQLARKSGISERYVAQIEAGKGNVSIVLLLRIAYAIRAAREKRGLTFALPRPNRRGSRCPALRHPCSWSIQTLCK